MPSAIVSSSGMAESDSVSDWLLDSDPSIRWQVMHDLLDTLESGEPAGDARAQMVGALRLMG